MTDQELNRVTSVNGHEGKCNPLLMRLVAERKAIVVARNAPDVCPH